MTPALSICFEGCIAPEDRSGLRGGVLKYWARLLQSLPDTVEGYVTGRHGLRGESWPGNVRQSFFPHFRPHRASLFCEDLATRSEELRGRFDLVHPMYYELGRISRRLKQRGTLLALTVYDLIQEKYIGQSDRLIATGAKREAIQAADLLVCISESTAADLQELYSVDRSRIRVIYPGNDLNCTGEGDRRTGLNHQTDGMSRSLSPFGPPYFLVVGNRSGYKNFTATAHAFALIAGKSKEVQLRLAGPPISAEESQLLTGLGIRDRVESIGRPSENDLAKAYAASVALIYPSLIEGFGFPIIEAMACGAPVITSDRSSLKEVAGGCARLANPEKPSEIAAAMEELLENSGKRTDLIARGCGHARQFQWDRAGKELAQAYSEILA